MMGLALAVWTACPAGEDPTPEEGCASNVDCAEPTSICDTATGTCVECLENAQCDFKPGTVCSLGSCVCPGGDTWCGPDLCVDTEVSPDHCGVCDHACFGACAGGECVDPWEPTQMRDAPTARAGHVAVWTGDSMIVWGGQTDSPATSVTNTGAGYTLGSYTWGPTSAVSAPAPRAGATAVWTGDAMIVWGGYDGTEYLDTGGIYEPAVDRWTATNVVGSPAGRWKHSAIWDPIEEVMVVFGGFDGSDQLASGGLYDPATGAWTPLATRPVARQGHTATWSPAEGRMLVFGGFGDTSSLLNVYLPAGGQGYGLSFDSATNSWTELAQPGTPAARSRHAAALAGDDLFLFGGFDGNSYLASGGLWTGTAWAALSGVPPDGRADHSAVYLRDAERLVIWGGRDADGALASGARFDPEAGSWDGPTPQAVVGRWGHTAISTGGSMIVWGGRDGNVFYNDGGVYSP
jgi:N-acetylneuraminic acid mutarotase